MKITKKDLMNILKDIPDNEEINIINKDDCINQGSSYSFSGRWFHMKSSDKKLNGFYIEID